MVRAFLLVLAAAVVAWGCSRGTDFPVITGSQEYDDLLAEAESLSLEPFQKHDRGEELDEVDRANLKKSLPLFRGLIAYRPEAFTLYLGLGKAHQVLGEDRKAIEAFESGAKAMTNPKDPVQKSTMAEMQYLGSVSFENVGEFELASIAAEKAYRLNDRNPHYLAALASARLREKKVDEANRLLAKALSIDPGHRRAKLLKKLIDAEKR